MISLPGKLCKKKRVRSTYLHTETGYKLSVWAAATESLSSSSCLDITTPISGKKSQMNKYFAFSSLVLSLWFLPLSKCCYLDLPLSWNKTTIVPKKNKKNLTKYLILYSEEICSKYPEQMSASQNPATVSGKHHKIREQTFFKQF